MPNSIPLIDDIENYSQNIVDTEREPLLILDATLLVQSANRAFYQTFHVSPAETEGRLIYELGNGQWDMNGYEVAKQIRQHPDLKHVVLVALTGYGQDSDRQASGQAGFTHHLVKPARFEELQKILATVAEQVA